MARVRSKRYRKLAEKVDAKKTYGLDEAVRTIKQLAGTKFDQTVTVAIHLGIDAKKSEQIIRGSVALPHGIGKSKRVVVFADGDEAAAAKAGGADEVGMAELAEKIQKGWTDFDVCVAVQRSMKVVSRLGKILGPKGLMPTPKNGTLLPDGKPDQVRMTVQEYKAGKVEYRNDAQGNIHAPVGKVSFPSEKLRENVAAFVETIRRLKPTTVKGEFLLNISVAPAMGPGLRIDLART
jgi:large subunit ribosomal protein L1